MAIIPDIETLPDGYVIREKDVLPEFQVPVSQLFV